MKNLLIKLLVILLSSHLFAQVEELSEVTVYATNYKYLNNIDTEEIASVPVKMLQQEVANYNVKESELYHDDYDEYIISFYIPQGKILAAYDRDGKILRTAERFKNINLPLKIKEAIVGRFPGWRITEDIYMLTYFENRGMEKKYKLTLENGRQVIRVKLDEEGNFL